MDAEKIIRKLIGYSETFLISALILYTTYNVYELTFSPGPYKLIPLYILVLAFYNYISLLFIQNCIPYNKRVCGICDKCKKIKVVDSTHCEICDACFYKKDHHCMWIGRCVAADNSREYYLFCLFFNLYLFARVGMDSNVLFVNVYLLFFMTVFNFYQGYKAWKKGREEDLCMREIFCRLIFCDGERRLMNVFMPFVIRSASVVKDECI